MLWWIVPLIVLAYPGRGSHVRWNDRDKEFYAIYRPNTLAWIVVKVVKILWARVMVWYYDFQEKRETQPAKPVNGQPAQPEKICPPF
jgi:hypothetical protein